MSAKCVHPLRHVLTIILSKLERIFHLAGISTTFCEKIRVWKALKALNRTLNAIYVYPAENHAHETRSIQRGDSAQCLTTRKGSCICLH